jgi:ABC-type multidrug transport system ATPase subunit
MIIRRGVALAIGSIGDLQKKLHGAPELEASLEAIDETLLAKVSKTKGVKAVRAEGPTSLIFDLDDPEAETPDVVKVLVQAGGRVKSVNILKPTLEDAYLELTKEESQ